VKRARLVIAFVSALGVVLSGPVAASAAVADDPRGDVAETAAAYLDIVHTKATEQIGRNTFYFQTVTAQPVPAVPETFVAYNWFVDVPGGLPFQDYVFTVRFCSQAVQRVCGPGPWHWESSENILATGVVNLNVFDFRIDGTTVTGFVDPALFGNPEHFHWFAASRDAPASTGRPSVDIAPDDPIGDAIPFDR